MPLTFASPGWSFRVRHPNTSSSLSAPRRTRTLRRHYTVSNRAVASETEQPPIPSGPSSNSILQASIRNQTQPDRDVVLVLGASGLLGREIVRQLLEKPGCIVVACVRSRVESAEAGLDTLAALVAQRQTNSGFGLRPSRLKILVADLFSQVPYIVSEAKRQCVGAIVFAASGGRDSRPGDIDNVAVRRLVSELQPWLGATGEARQLPIFDFENCDPQTLNAFRSVDDRVMGGVSTSQMIKKENATTVMFCGDVSTAKNGGFAQARAFFDADSEGKPLPTDLSIYVGVSIRCRGDGRRYKINLKDTEKPEQVFQASFGTIDGQWQTVRLPFSEFTPIRRGRLAYRDGPGLGTYQSALDLNNIISIGILVSKIEPGGGVTPGFTAGPFRLEISSISAYRPSAPRFLLVSSASVTRPFWSEEKKALARTAAEIPIVKLNPFNILGHKLAGENAVRRGTIPWTIVRLTGLEDLAPSGRKLFVEQGDILMGTLNRADAASGVVSALRTTASTWKTFELGARDARNGEDSRLTEAQIATLGKDTAETQYAAETDSLVDE